MADNKNEEMKVVDGSQPIVDGEEGVPEEESKKYYFQDMLIMVKSA
jgi:hypothetical protein